MSFVHLQVASAYSLLTSTIDIHKLVLKAKNLGFKALALTDRNVMYGAVPFYKECQKHGIKPIIGLTADVKINETDRAFPLVLLAKSNTGYQNLLKISSVIGTKSQEGISARWLKGYGKGLYVYTPGLDGKIEQLLLQNQMEEAEETVVQYKQLFEPNSFFLSLQHYEKEEERNVLPLLKQLGQKTRTPLLVTNPVKFLEKEDSFAYECLLAIGEGVKLSDENRSKVSSEEHYLKTTEEMVELFHDEVDALENTMTIANVCDVTMEFGQSLLPTYPLPDNVKAKNELKRLCEEGLQKRKPNSTEEYKGRLQYELDIIDKMGFSDYFLIVWDFMEFARRKRIITGPGRGSSAGSLVAYSLFITDVDPLQYNLLFERFLNPERVTMPDIDIDFPDHRRDEVISYVVQKYGKLHASQIITFGTFGTKASLRDTARIFGLNSKEQERLSRLIPSRMGITLREAYQESTGLQKFVDESLHHKRLFHTALKLEGLPRHTSTHAAGVIISDVPLVQLVPLQEGTNGVYLTQYPMDILESIGLLKMDFLGLRNLTLLERIVDLIHKASGEKVDLNGIPYQDKKTFSLLCRGETTGIFQLESDGMRNVLKNLRPNSFEDIVAVNALYRPGPMENIPLYIRRKYGEEATIFPHPDLKPILQNTYGVIVYQEQIMQIASKMAGFTLGEADILRRAVSKKKKEVLDEQRQYFVSGALKKGYSENIAHVIYDLIVKFANYGFPRSHAVAYSMIAYQLAYLKAHYPAYFMAALLTSAIGNDDKIVNYIHETRQMGISILPPSINKGSFPFTVEKEGLRFSLAAIKGVGRSALQAIVSARKEQPFQDLFDFCLRVSGKAVNRKVLESLIFAGALDDFGQDRAVLLATLDVALDHAELIKPKDGEFVLFDDEDSLLLKPKYVEVESMKLEDKLSFESQSTGLFLSAHPVSMFNHLISRLNAVHIVDIPLGKKEVGVIIYINDIKTIRTKKGDVMAFMTGSDHTGQMEGVVFPDTYRKFGKLLMQGASLYITGHMEERKGKRQFIVKSTTSIEQAEELVKQHQKLYIKLPVELNEVEVMEEIQVALLKYKGTTPVVVYFEKEKRSIQLASQYFVSVNSNLLEEIRRIIGQNNLVIK
ncbi:DNA polymerase III subunit alpha [Bacillus spongiae]|uniref:DNA polymerase III subunit alpha n=1 Tax=Bacillus spongiae TaxID=2683610 RepID=A0ABU8H8F7_9BACI